MTDPQDPANRRPIPTRVKIIITCIMLALSAGAIRLAVYVGRKEGFSKSWPKPFGLGVNGPAFIGGRDTIFDGKDFVFGLYTEYRRYRNVTGVVSTSEEDYYARWTDRDECLGSCRENSFCQKGVCVCDGDRDYVHLYGLCEPTSSAFHQQLSDRRKYRESDVNSFDETSLPCGTSDHRTCQNYDTNMYCSSEGKCVCRQDMGFDRRHMECELKLNVDCSSESGYDFVTDEDQRVLEIVSGTRQLEPGSTLDKQKAKKAFCVILDGKADEYNTYRQEEYDLLILGLNLMGFILLIFALLICFSTLCFCMFYIQDFIHFLDPRNAMAAITATNTEMSNMA